MRVRAFRDVHAWWARKPCIHFRIGCERGSFATLKMTLGYAGASATIRDVGFLWGYARVLQFEFRWRLRE
jgi:hypothetical protein